MEEARNRRILNGWKQISSHLDRGVRTAQRWEALLGLPIHRPALKDRSAVVAFSDELDLWLARTPPDARDQCLAVNEKDQNKDQNQERLLRVLDNMSTLVQQSCALVSQVRTLQEQLRRSRNSRRVALKIRAPSAPGRSGVLPFRRRRHSSLLKKQVSAGMVDAAGVR
jgi:hypothetical protein